VVVQHEMIYSCDKKEQWIRRNSLWSPNIPENVRTSPKLATVIHLLSVYVIYGVY